MNLNEIDFFQEKETPQNQPAFIDSNGWEIKTYEPAPEEHNQPDPGNPGVLAYLGVFWRSTRKFFRVIIPNSKNDEKNSSPKENQERTNADNGVEPSSSSSSSSSSRSPSSPSSSSSSSSSPSKNETATLGTSHIDLDRFHIVLQRIESLSSFQSGDTGDEVGIDEKRRLLSECSRELFQLDLDDYGTTIGEIDGDDTQLNHILGINLADILNSMDVVVIDKSKDGSIIIASRNMEPEMDTEGGGDA